MYTEIIVPDQNATINNKQSLHKMNQEQEDEGKIKDEDKFQSAPALTLKRRLFHTPSASTHDDTSERENGKIESKAALEEMTIDDGIGSMIEAKKEFCANLGLIAEAETQLVPYFEATSDSADAAGKENEVVNILTVADKPIIKAEPVELSNEFKPPLSPNGINDTDSHISSSTIHEDSGEIKDEPVCFVNQDAKVTPIPVLQYVLDSDQPYDIVMCCSDGKIGAHRLVLKAASPFIGEMFCEYNHRLGEVAVLMLPDVPVRLMKILLTFCYTGKMLYSKEDEPEVLEVMQLLLLGELADLSVNEVTINAVPPSEPEPLTSTHAEQLQPDLVTVSSSINEVKVKIEEPEPTSDDEDDCMTSSDEDEKDEANEKENCGGQDRTKSSNSESGENSPIHYLVVPQSGSQCRRLQCCYCPGGFKSLETMSSHLENKHEIILESRKLEQDEEQELSRCDHCNKQHDLIASANGCLSKHSRTRCLVCFKVFRHSQFEEHMKSTHQNLSKEKRKYIVKCRWCDAGVVFNEQFDNKNMAAHCFSQHFPGSRVTFSAKTSNSSSIKTKISKTNIKHEAKISKTNIKQEAKISKTNIKQETKISKSKSPKILTPPTSSTSSKEKRPLPAVLALFQKASLKRKLEQDLASAPHIKIENPEKRARIETSSPVPKPKHQTKQVAKRTGKPVGRLVNLAKTLDGVPALRGKCRSKSKVKSVDLSLGSLPQIYVRLNYNKSYIHDVYTDALERAETHGTSSSLSCRNNQPATVHAPDHSFRCSMPIV